VGLELPDHVRDEPGFDHAIAVDNEKRLVDDRSGFEQRVAAAELFLLGDVLELDIAVGRAEMLLNAVALVADHHHDLLNPGVDQCVEDVLQNWPVRRGEHRLGAVVRQGAQPVSFPGREDDGCTETHYSPIYAE